MGKKEDSIREQFDKVLREKFKTDEEARALEQFERKFQDIVNKTKYHFINALKDCK